MKHFRYLTLIWLVCVGCIAGALTASGRKQILYERPFGIKWNPNGSSVAITTRNYGVWVWSDGTLALLLHGFIDDVSWSPDGNSMAILRRRGSLSVIGTIEIWDVSTLSKPVMLNSFEDRNLYDEGPRQLHWHPSDNLLAVTGLGIRVWDTDSGALVRSIEPAKPVIHLEWSPDGSSIASYIYSNSINIWDSSNGTLRQQLTFPLSSFQFAWGNDSQHIAVAQSSSPPEQQHEIHIIDLQQAESPEMIIARDSAIGLIAWRGDILTMWVRDVNGVEVLDVSSQQVLTTIVDYEGSTPVLSPDGTKIAYATEDGVFHVVPVPARSP